jgi:hypothetical protein
VACQCSGTLKIAEVNSRFDMSGKEDGAEAATQKGKDKFIEAIQSFGFQLKTRVCYVTIPLDNPPTVYFHQSIHIILV